MVINRSLCVEMVLVDAMAGIAQAFPDKSGKTLFPLIPNFRIQRSKRNTIRAKYPLSSSQVFIKNNRAI